jgi:hypothetical protein
MSRTTTRYLDFQTLRTRGPSAATVVKLMMACNDLSLANQALTEWKTEQTNQKKARQLGAGMYFIRTQFSHLNEGMKIIKAIRADQSLMALVSQCDRQTQSSFSQLEYFLPKGKNSKEFETIVGRIRNNITFHYDESGSLIERSIANIAGKAKDRTSAITRGSTAHLWYFAPADRVVNDIVCHEIWRIPRDADVMDEANKIADRCHEIAMLFLDFAGEFIWRYCEL